MTPPLKTFPYPIRLLLVFGLFGISLLLINFLAVGMLLIVYHTLDLNFVLQKLTTDFYTIMLVQGLSSVGGFILTSMLLAYFEWGNVSESLRLNNTPPIKMVVLAIFSILVAQFFIDFLVEVNSKIPLPHSLQFLKAQEETLKALTDKMLDFKGLLPFALVSVVMAVIPALGEEMFFRGLLLGDMLKAKISPAASIIVSGLIFAVFHFEFQNTLAIWALGCFLGYLYYVSGSLWLPITVHFVNNFLEILLKYLYNNHLISIDAGNTPTPVYATLISIAVFAWCLSTFYKWKRHYVINDELLQDEVNTMER